MQKLIHIPDGLVPSPGEIETVYIAEHVQMQQRAVVAGIPATFHYPVVMMNLGVIQNHRYPDGRQWLPTLADLTEHGRMLRAMLHDNLQLAGCHEELTSAVTEPKYYN